MGNFKFKPESVLEFSCPGIGTSTTQSEAVTYFKRYLGLIGKSADSNGYLDTDTFMVRTCTTTAYQTGTLDKQHSDKYKNGTTVLYKGCLYDSYWASFTGYVVLPFKVNGNNVKLVLPGTILSSYNNLGLRTSGTGTITRTSSGITVTGTSTSTTSSTQFENGIVPLFCIAVGLGGGGGGSSSEALVAGRGGGGGSCSMGVLSFIGNNIYNFSVGAGGAGGYHIEGTDSSTSSHHDGASGNSTFITTNNGATTLIGAGGGKGGVAQSTSRANGGSVSTNNCPYKLYPISGSGTITNKVGGTGSVDTNTTGSSVSITEFSTMSTATGRQRLSKPNIFESKTYAVGTSYNPGGAGGGATCFLNGANGGSAASVGSNGSDGYGNGGGGGGYLVGSYIDGGKGGSGRVQFWC